MHDVKRDRAKIDLSDAVLVFRNLDTGTGKPPVVVTSRDQNNWNEMSFIVMIPVIL
jgi:hypothetical protein